MANFIIVIDPDGERRRRFAESVMPELPPVRGLVTNSLGMGDCLIAWASRPEAPVTWVREKNCAAVEWGEPVDDRMAHHVKVSHLMQLWADRDTRDGAFFNGYYAAAVFSADTGLVVGADLLGIYPVYYWSAGDVMLAGSSPELFRYHPSFRMRLDPHGLTAVLLAMHIFDGETLLKGVRRLRAGHLLTWNGEDSAREVKQYEIRVSTDMYDLPFSAHVEALDNAIDEAVGRSLPAGQQCSLLLSGGLDSRMLGGYLRERGADINAITLGLESDIEMQVARQVARELEFQHDGIEVTYDKYAACANRQATWEHVCNGFNDILNWGVNEALASHSPFVIMGHAMDAAVGTRSIGWAYSPTSKSLSFETFFQYVNRWGIDLMVLERLLRPDTFAGMVEDVVARIRDSYRHYSEMGSQQAWCFNLYNRQRFHVGSSAWALSFGAWPVMPVLDRRLLECAASIPAASIAERRAQTELVCRRFSRLAALPLDRNSYDTRPLQPRLRYQLAQSVLKRCGPLRRLLEPLHSDGHERRYYYRTYDIDNPGWQSVRRQAEPERRKLYDIFDERTLDELLPRPDVRTKLQDRIVDASGLKLLTGLMTWSGGHL
jgi:asparagine synthase (glutamine-hydrolysing)